MDGHLGVWCLGGDFSYTPASFWHDCLRDVERITDLAFSDDGRRLACVAWDNAVYVLDAPSDAAVGAGGDLVFDRCNGGDGDAPSWKPGNGATVVPSTYCAWSPDGASLAVTTHSEDASPCVAVLSVGRRRINGHAPCVS